MSRTLPFLWVLSLILMLSLGIYVGAKVTTANKDIKIMDLEVQLETERAALAEANVELAFWQSTLKNLAEGGQIEGVDINRAGEEE